MTTQHFPEAPEPTPQPARPAESLSEALARVTLAGLDPAAVQLLSQARDHLEHRLAQIAAGRFEIHSWCDADGDVLSMSVRVWPEPPAKSLSEAPAPTLRTGDLRWPNDWPG